MTKIEQKIPEGWSVKKLGKCVHIFGGYAYDSSECTSVGIKWLKIANVGKGKLEKSEFDYLPLEYKVNTKNYLLKKGDIVMALTRPITDNQLKIAYIDDDEYLLNQRVGKLLFSDDTCADFMYNKLTSSKIVCRISSLLIGTDPPNLTGNVLNQINILLPPLPEQEKIAGILGTWDEAIEKLSSLIEQKKNLKKGLMQKLLTGKTRLKGFTQPWKEVKLGEIGTTYTGLSGKNKDDFGKGSYFIPYMNIYQNNKIDSNQLELVDVLENESQNSVQYGDIFFTTSSETPEEVGFASVLLFHPKEKIYLNSFCFGYRLNNFNTLLPNFAVYLFRSSQIRKTMFKLAQGATRFNLSKNTLIKEKVYLPSDTNEQQAIADVLSTADEEINLLNKKLEALKEQKKGLMQQLLTGQTRVKVN